MLPKTLSTAWNRYWFWCEGLVRMILYQQGRPLEEINEKVTQCRKILHYKIPTSE